MVRKTAAELGADLGVLDDLVNAGLGIVKFGVSRPFVYGYC